MIWRQCYVLENSSSPWGGGFLPSKMLKIPPMIVIFKICQILLKICILSNLMVLNFIFDVILTQKSFCNPPGGILAHKNIETLIVQNRSLLPKITNF